MGKIEVFHIELDDPQLIYNPGDTINGRVVLQTNADISLNAVCVKFRGKGYVAWKRGKVYHFTTENYIDTVVPVAGQKQFQRAVCTLKAGNHSFPFAFPIPVGAPGSFERPVGSVDCHVRYWLKAFVDGTKDEYKLAITIASALDLNLITDAMESGEKNKSKNVCCLCCRSGPITVRARTDRTAYVPGDTIRAEIELEDNTGRGTNDTAVKLWQSTTSISYEMATFNVGKSVAKISRGGLEPHGSDSWVQEIEVPPIPVTGLPGSNIIDIQYSVLISVDIRSTPVNLDIHIPIIIGSIPHRLAAQRYPIGPSGDNTQHYHQGGLGEQKAHHVGRSQDGTIENSRQQSETTTTRFEMKQSHRNTESSKRPADSSAKWNDSYNQREEWKSQQDSKQYNQRSMIDSSRQTNDRNPQQYALQYDHNGGDNSFNTSSDRNPSQNEPRKGWGSSRRSGEHGARKYEAHDKQGISDYSRSYEEEPDSRRYSGHNVRVSPEDVSLQTKENTAGGYAGQNQRVPRESASRHADEHRARRLSGHNQRAAKEGGSDRYSDGSYPTQSHRTSRDEAPHRYLDDKNMAQTRQGRRYSGNTRPGQDQRATEEDSPRRYSGGPRMYSQRGSGQAEDGAARRYSNKDQQIAQTYVSGRSEETTDLPPPQYRRHGYELEEGRNDSNIVTML